MIKIDDHAVLICLIVTALMVLTVVSFAQIYPLNEPGPWQVVSSGPRAIWLQPQARKARIEDPKGAVQVAASRPAARLFAVPKIIVPADPPAAPKQQPAPAGKVSNKPIAEISRKPKNRMETIRGGRHAGYASIVFQFAEPVDFDQPRIEGREIRLRLKNTTSGLPAYRRYKTFDSWVRLKETARDIDVEVGIPEKFIKFLAFRMDIPPRLVVNLYDRKGKSAGKREEINRPGPQPDIKRPQEKVASQSTARKGPAAAQTEKRPNRLPVPSENHRVRLRTVRGGRHDLYASIVVEFTHPVKFTPPRLDGPEIRLELKDTATRLQPFRKYKTFDSWVRLNKAAGDQQVRIGVPEKFLRFSAFLMADPHRLVINLYDRKN